MGWTVAAALVIAGKGWTASAPHEKILQQPGMDTRLPVRERALLLLTHAKPEIRMNAASVLVRYKEEDVTHALKKALAQERVGRARSFMLEQLQEQQPFEAFADIVQAVCHDVDPTVRLMAAELLSRYPDADITVQVLEALEGETSPPVRQALFQAIVGADLHRNPSDDRLVPVLTRMISREKDGEVRAGLVSILGLVHHPSSFQALTLVVERDPHEKTVCYAVGRLGESEQPEAVEALERIALGSKKASVKLTAVQVLGRLLSQEAFDALHRVREKGSPQVRAAAQRVLLDVGELTDGFDRRKE